MKLIYARLMLVLITISCSQTKTELEEPSSIKEFIENKVRMAFSSGGVTAAKDVLSKELDNWKKSPIHIGVTGNSGVGKSSFINAIRGLSADDEGAAEVGVIETTQRVSSYQHPNNKNLLFSDLPGVGTPNFPKENYTKDIKANNFDYFIIMSADRFTENDLWLAKEMVSLRKAFYFVRSKVGQDIENYKKSHPKSHDKKPVLEAIRTNCNQNLQGIMNLNKASRVYLIDNFDVDNFDFGLLSAKLIEDAPEMKKEAITMSLNVFSKELILAKKEALNNRIYKVALLSALADLVPLPGPDYYVDATVLLEESQFYRYQFGLDEDSMRNHSKLYEMELDEFIKMVDLESIMIEFSESGIITFLSKIGVTNAAGYVSKQIVKYTLPVVGSIISSSAAYTSSTLCLQNILDIIVRNAMKINDYNTKE